MPIEHSCVEFKIIFGFLFMTFAVFLSVLINSGYFALDYLFVISRHVFLFHFLPLLLYFKWGEFIPMSGIAGEIAGWFFWCKPPTFQSALPEKYCSSELLYSHLPTGVRTHPSFGVTLTLLSRGINGEFIFAWCRGANPFAIPESRGVTAGATRRNGTAANPPSQAVGSWECGVFAATGARYWLAVINNLGPNVFGELPSFLLLFWSVEWFSRS